MTVVAVVGLLGALAAGPERAPRWVEVILAPSGRKEALLFRSLVPAPVAGWLGLRPLESYALPAARVAIEPRPTCTVRVLPAGPLVDPGMVLDVPQDVDPGMTLPSRCAE
jgi:hypothetical protein